MRYPYETNLEKIKDSLLATIGKSKTSDPIEQISFEMGEFIFVLGDGTEIALSDLKDMAELDPEMEKLLNKVLSSIDFSKNYELAM